MIFILPFPRMGEHVQNNNNSANNNNSEKTCDTKWKYNLFKDNIALLFVCIIPTQPESMRGGVMAYFLLEHSWP